MDAADALTNLGLVTLPGTILSLITSLPRGKGGYFTVAGGVSDSPDAGYTTGYFIPSAANYDLGFAIVKSDGGGGNLYFRQYYQGAWGGDWKQLATATPPQEFDLPITDKVLNARPSKYWKNQFEEVSFTVDLHVPTGQNLEAGNVIAVLPIGFRPKTEKAYSSAHASSSVRTGGDSINITSNGAIIYHGLSLMAGDALWGTGSFAAL